MILPFFQCLDVKEPTDECDETLNCPSLTWTTKDEMDLAIDFSSTIPDVFLIRERYVVEPFSSLK